LARRRGSAAAKSRAVGCSASRQVEAADVAVELREAEVDQAVQLADPVVEVPADPVAVHDELAQGLVGAAGQARRPRPLLERQPGEAPGVDGVGLGALQARLLEAAGEQRVEQRDMVARRCQDGEQVLPVVAGRLHGDQYGRRAERAERGVVAGPVLGERQGLADRLARVVEAGEHVALGCDVDACEHGTSSVGRTCTDQCQGASEPTFMPVLVQAGTPAGKARPRDTVRAANAGRGRQSHARGRSPERHAATLSQQPERTLMPGAPR
jgi:hypothetical protein